MLFFPAIIYPAKKSQAERDMEFRDLLFDSRDNFEEIVKLISDHKDPKRAYSLFKEELPGIELLVKVEIQLKKMGKL
ncbi:hypothetical protein A3K34_01595 [candidate division WWE3 bacterium RIFOXYC1_FULL_40_10]|uniref:Uncharacterized protein n=1 Tax=candidate division WWE3 bacterium RIFOXYA2_FULL_46_9 TaxID=1802636 RepID=A0A1F4W2M4_UNCKA|nr:MAG: hypothetical protein A3K58_01595 [candidate division WWE3 bacterium RIFOXYB1_FULL_40_22]OGC61559.1 MAG: hypothetical protein A3K37_01595 [candidate division WWE3 bacterium RIFOXYA1_FULL_40_11]OGC63605.1 MAG: hypothetical protein A2264_04535 [candidate division WWE3 bacterium RIFOXYA2_FULL_46_9]OGC64762.1 MAG: hypothetical protein A2326_01860 [candidate division WWE3 bacterium RIFOXYB2_FULL_41_6]OGC65942.1 MAG: hypothetical protein A3K34_01595 [candidate division WWE3 bacterium RIFOXYC1_